GSVAVGRCRRHWSSPRSPTAPSCPRAWAAAPEASQLPRAAPPRRCRLPPSSVQERTAWRRHTRIRLARSGADRCPAFLAAMGRRELLALGRLGMIAVIVLVLVLVLGE